MQDTHNENFLKSQWRGRQRFLTATVKPPCLEGSSLNSSGFLDLAHYSPSTKAQSNLRFFLIHYPPWPYLKWILGPMYNLETVQFLQAVSYPRKYGISRVILEFHESKGIFKKVRLMVFWQYSFFHNLVELWSTSLQRISCSNNPWQCEFHLSLVLPKKNDS